MRSETNKSKEIFFLFCELLIKSTLRMRSHPIKTNKDFLLFLMIITQKYLAHAQSMK